jgi:hypothetical protein
MALVAQAQTVVPDNLRAAMSLDRLGSTSGNRFATDFVYGIPSPPGTVIGDYYMNPRWLNSSIVLYSVEKPIENYKTRYDIKLNELEVKTSDAVKVVPGTRIKSFAVYDSAEAKPRFYINARDFDTVDGNKLEGFFEVLEEGKATLLKRMEVSIKKADYNATLAVGSRDDKILKKDVFYVLKDKRVEELRLQKKKIMPLFGDKAGQVQEMANKKGLSFSKQDHLEMIFAYYNKLAAN